MPDIIDKAKAGLLSRQELDDVAGRLERRELSGDLHEKLLVMMFGGDARYRRAVEPYLDSQANLEIARSAKIGPLAVMRPGPCILHAERRSMRCGTTSTQATRCSSGC